MVCPSNPVHGFKDVLTLHAYGQSHFLADLVHAGDKLSQRHVARGDLRRHHHGEIALHNGLADVQNVDVEVRQSGAMRAQWMKYQTDFDYAAGITWDTVLDTVETLCMKTLDDHAFGDELPQEESQFEMHLL